LKNIQPFVLSFLNISVLALVLISFAPGTHAQASQSAPTPQPTLETQSTCNASRSLQVSGSAVINVTPDRVLIQLGVQSTGSTVGAVDLANSLAIQNVIEALRFLDIQPKDIATDRYVIEPVYENYDSLRLKGYRINNIVAVTLRDVSKTSTVISRALQAGANQIMNVEFYTSELRKYRDQARDMAMQAASEKARALAMAAGTETSCVLSINENSGSSYYGGWYGGRDQNLWAQNSVQNAAPPASSGTGTDVEPVSLGQVAVRADVGVSFSLK
jgi:uncharacterized protein YggE